MLNANDVPNLSKVTSMINTFRGAVSLVDQKDKIGTWDVSNVIRMDRLFQSASIFNENINNWNVSKVTNMDSMFDSALIFDQPLNNWNV